MDSWACRFHTFPKKSLFPKPWNHTDLDVTVMKGMCLSQPIFTSHRPTCDDCSASWVEVPDESLAGLGGFPQLVSCLSRTPF